MAVNMVPTKSVVVIRDGKRVKPVIGESFPFTAEERDALLAEDEKVLRKPVNEDEGSATVRTAEGSQAKAKGGKKKATANTADSESDGDLEPEEGEGGGAGAGTDDDL